MEESEKGLSVGVFSIAVKLIIDRENEIKALFQKNTGTLWRPLQERKKAFTANYYGTTSEKAALEKEVIS